jgi:alcohol dehydrogenase class IV
MKEFSFYCPVNIIFENGAVEKLAQLAAPAKSVMVVTGKSSAKKSGLLERITQIIKKSGAETVAHASAESNPSVKTIEQAAERAVSDRVELVVGVGGGSAMDAAKAIAVKATNEKPLRELFLATDFAQKPLRLICVPTTAGTGSEMNQYAIINDNMLGDKFNLNSRQTYPQYALLDPELSVDLPQSVTVDTGIDALTHAVEGYIARRSQPFSDFIALQSITLIRDNLPLLFQDGKDLDARGKMLYAAALAGIVISHTGTTALHALGYHLTLKFNVPHGRANAALLAHYLKSIEKGAPGKIEKIYSIFEKGSSSTGVGSIFEFVRSLGVSTKLGDYGIDHSELGEYRDYVAARKNVKNTPVEFMETQIDQLLIDAME